jgi:hypothetical protein
MKNDSAYSDIIHLPHHVSAVHPQMSRSDRAAQFSPFAALTGYDAVIKETARFTDERVELGEYEQEELNESFQMLKKIFSAYPPVRITYFKPDERKKGGAYLTVTTQVKQLNEYERFLVLQDGTKISFSDIYAMVLEQETQE